MLGLSGQASQAQEMCVPTFLVACRTDPPCAGNLALYLKANGQLLVSVLGQHCEADNEALITKYLMVLKSDMHP